jgi:hypothetical protein
LFQICSLALNGIPNFASHLFGLVVRQQLTQGRAGNNQIQVELIFLLCFLMCGLEVKSVVLPIYDEPPCLQEPPGCHGRGRDRGGRLDAPGSALLCLGRRVVRVLFNVCVPGTGDSPVLSNYLSSVPCQLVAYEVYSLPADFLAIATQGLVKAEYIGAVKSCPASTKHTR